MNPQNPTPTKSGAISLADEDAVRDLLVGTVFGLWDIVNNLKRLQPSKRERYDVRIPKPGKTRAESHR